MSAFSCGLSGQRSLGFDVLFRWGEPDVIDRCPVSGVVRPPGRVGTFGVLVNLVSVRQDRDVLPAMTLAGGDEADLAVAVFLVVPVYEAREPGAGVGEAGKRLTEGAVSS